MFDHEIQLWYVIRDKIREKFSPIIKFSLRKNLRKIDFVTVKIFLEKKIVRKKMSWMLSQISSVQGELSRTNICLSSLRGIYIPHLKIFQELHRIDLIG